VIKAVLDAGMLSLAVLAVVFSVIGAFYYLRVVKLMYFDEPAHEVRYTVPVDFNAAISLNGLLMLGLGLFSSSLVAMCMRSFPA
jgi:NADH-quinone oxidoreductase subunit N